MRRSLLGREGKWWTEKACQTGLSTCAEERNWRHSICREFIRIVMEIENLDGIN